MIFIFLGFFFLIFWSFSQAREKLEATFLRIQKNWVQDNSPSFIKHFLHCLGFAVLSASPHRARLTGIALSGMQKRPWRWSLCLISLSAMAVLFWAGFLSLTFQWSGGVLLLAGFGALLIPKKWPSLISFFWSLFFLGLFLHSMENTLRMSSFLTQEVKAQDIFLVLSDNRLPAVLGWLLFSAIITVFLPFEGWAWIFSVLALSMGVMGLNVALGFVIGESLGAAFVFWRVVRKQAPDFKKIILEYLSLHFFAAAIFFIVFGWLKSEFYEMSSLSSGPLSEKIILFLICALAWSGLITILSLVWGHFKALKANGSTLSAGSAAQWQQNQGILPTFVQELFSLSQMGKDQGK